MADRGDKEGVITMRDSFKVRKNIEVNYEISIKELAESFASATDFEQFVFLKDVVEEFNDWDKEVPMCSQTQLLRIAESIVKYSHYDTSIDEWLETLLEYIRKERKNYRYEER